MRYRRLGKTELRVSEIGLGGEWLEKQPYESCEKVIRRCEEYGVNILDCWMSKPNVRSNIGRAIEGHREKWYIQGHIGSTWQNGQYVRTRDLQYVRPAFEDILTRMRTDYIDLGMIHYVDSEKEWHDLQDSDYLRYVFSLKEAGTIKHIGLSTHNLKIAKLAAASGFVEMILFSVNPAFDLLPAQSDLDAYFGDDAYHVKANGIDPERAEVYTMCEKYDVGITVMKGFAGGRLFDAARSPFGVALTPMQCVHYALTRPAVASVLAGMDTKEHVDGVLRYETASDNEKDYASVLAGAPLHAFSGQCTYCGHCKPCPKNIDIALVNKFYDLAVEHEEVPATVRSHYLLLDTKASDCIGCKSCESRCPFGVKIAQRMKDAKELFGA